MKRLVYVAGITVIVALSATFVHAQTTAPTKTLTTRALSAKAAKAALAGKPTAAEEPFVTAVSANLRKRFPTTAEALAAGYLRFTDEDRTGAISWVNQKHWDSDELQPSQLWYDVDGRLIGADFSVLQSERKTPPHLWSIDPARWQPFIAHVHYGLIAAHDTTHYGGIGPKRITAAGGDPDDPRAKDLVAAGVAPTIRAVRFVFPFPAIWDLQVWLIPNPLGAFADKNPDIVPSPLEKHSGM